MAGEFDLVFDRFVTAVVVAAVEGENLVRNVAIDEIGIAAPVEIIAGQKGFASRLIGFSGEVIGVRFAGVDEAGGAVFRHGRVLL